MADVYSIQGFLWKYKKGVTGGSWKKNWVYADSTVIAQYGGNQRPLPTEAPKYKWKIADCSIRSSDLRRFAFEVTMHGGGSGVSETAIFAADDSKSFEKWMKILIDTHVERERQEQSQSEERYSYDEVEAMRGGEEKSSVDVAPWQRVEQQAKDFFKRNKAKGTMTVADLIDLIHSIDERLVPHRVLTFLAIETKRTLDSAISLQDFIAFWRLYHYLFLPSEEEFHVFYSKDSRDVCFSPTTTTTTTTIPSNPSTTTNTATSSLFSEWNLLSSLSSDLSEVKVHPLYFRMHIPTTPTTSTPPNPTTPNSSNESKTRGLLLSLFQCYSPHTTATSLEGVSGGWHEVQCDLLHRLEEVRARIREVYEQRIYPSLEAKKEVLSEVVVVAPVVVERRGSAVTSSSDPIHSASAGNHTSELRALDEELLQVMSALALLQALFLSTAMKGARTVVDEFTLPQHLKTMRFVGNTPHSSDRGSGGGSVIGDDVMVFESQGIHFQLLNSLTLLQPSPNHPTTTTTTGTGVLGSDVIESALIARESLYDKYVAQEMKSFQYLNHSLHKRLLLQQLQQTYFPYLTSSSSSSSSDVMSSLRRSFLVQKMTSVVDYGGFRVLAFVPNHPPNQTTSSALLPEEQRASLLEEVQRGLAVKLPDGQAVGIESITLAQPTHAHPLHAKTAVTSRTVYYLTCKLLLPSDLTALHTSEVYMKSLRPELLQAYVTHISSNEREEGEQRQPPLILSTKELLDLYRDNADVSGRASSPSSLPHTSSSLFAEWREVCRFLYRQRIPRFVELLDNYDVMPYDSLSLTHAMHRHGLNMRHVGVVYSLCRNVIVKQLLLSDVIARGVKAVVRAMTKAHVYGQKQLSVVAERRQRSSASDFDELNAVTQTTKTDVIVEVLNLLFPTTSNTPSSTSSEATSAPEPQLHYLHYLRSHRKEEVLHFYELLLHVIEEKFGLTLTLSPHYSRGTSSGEGEEKEVLAEGVTSEHPLAHYSLHCFQLLSAVTYHLQVRLKEHVFHTSSQSSGGGAAVTSAGRSIVFSSNSMMIMKARDLTVLDLLDHHIATPSPTSSCFDHYDADDGVRLSSAGGPVYREEYSLLLPSFFSFLAHQRHLLADVTVVHTSYGRRAREEMMGMVTWRERQLILSEHVFDHSPNDPATYANYLKEVFAVAWSKWQMGGQEATYLLIEEKFLHRATFLHEYSLYNIPLYLLLMVVQYTQYTSYTQAMINYDLAHDVITTILPFSHPMLTLPMTVLAELYLTYPSHLSSHLLEDEDERERHYRSARRESLEYAKFFYQLALSVWRYTTTPATSSNHNLSSTTLTKTIANTAASSSSSAVIPVLVLQYKLAILQVELGELSDAVPVLQSCSKALETLLNSLLHQNYTSHTSHSSSGKKSKEVEKEVQGERIQAMTIVLRLLIPATYQLALCHYRLEEYDVALSLYQKTYQLFNKIIFNDALTRAMTSDSSSNTSSSVFLSLMSQNFYEVLLSSLLSMYDIYLLKHESALALDVLMLVYRLFVSKGYQSYLMLSSFYYYQHILWKLFCKMNELCVITLPMNVQALLESVTVEWNELMAGKGGHDTSAPPSSPGRSSDVARQRKNNQKLFSVACKLLVEIMFRGEMMDYVIQLLQMIQKQIHEDNALRYQYHNSGSAQFGPLEFNPQMDIKQLVNSIPTYAQAAAVSLLLKQPKDFAKYIM